MINIQIKTDGKDVLDSCNIKDITLQEVAIVIYRLEQIKLDLLNKDFESKFEVTEDYD